MSDKSYQVYNQECKDSGFINVDVHGEIQRLKEGSSMLILQRCVCRGMGEDLEIAPLVICLPCKHEGLSLVPRTHVKKKKKARYSDTYL